MSSRVVSVCGAWVEGRRWKGFVKASSGKIGGRIWFQHTDDPDLMLGVMQAGCRTHRGSNLTQTEIDRIYEYLQQEALEYHNRFSNYVETRDYEPYLKDIKAMLDRMKKEELMTATVDHFETLRKSRKFREWRVHEVGVKPTH